MNQPISMQDVQIRCLVCGDDMRRIPGTETERKYKCRRGHVRSLPKPQQRTGRRWTSGPDNAA